MHTESLSDIIEVYFKTSFVNEVKKAVITNKESYYLHRYLSTYYLIIGQMEKGVTEVNGHVLDGLDKLYTRAFRLSRLLSLELIHIPKQLHGDENKRFSLS